MYLASLRTILNWAVREDLLTENVANKVRQEVPKKILKRPKGYTDDEALRILKASLAYSPAPFMDGEPREYAETTAAKKWVPLLCAFTGARVTEITQIRKQDVRQEGDTWVARITPDAGTVKTGLFRDVPLHRQIVALGFMDYVNAAPDGPLFYRGKADKIELGKARMVSGRISVWLQDLELVPEGVSPNHAWRHRFKTVAREIGASDRITDAICGHAGRTAGEEYGDVTVIAKKRLVERLPDYSL